MAQETNYKIPSELLALIKKEWGGYFRSPFEKVVNYLNQNEVLVYEYPRRNVKRSIDITRDVIGKSLEEAIEYLSGIKQENAYLDIDCDDHLVLLYSEMETDAEWARRVYYSVFSPADRAIAKAKDKKKELIKEREELQKRLKELNSLI